MPKNQIKYPTDFLRRRRLELGLEPCEVATLMGIRFDLYRQIECRGQIPEQHLEALSRALDVPQETLLAEKVAALAEGLLGIHKLKTHAFVKRSLAKK